MRSYWLETLGCPKNAVDGDKLEHALQGDGYEPARRPEQADLVVVNTCAFIEAARQESVDVILGLSQRRGPDARLVVTGCLAERYGEELAEALPEVDLVAGFGQPLTDLAGTAPTATTTSASPVGSVPVMLGTAPRRRASGGHPPPPPQTQRDGGPPGPSTPLTASSFDLLELPRGSAEVPWAYVKVAEGCDRRCGFCAIPSFRGAQRSRRQGDILEEVRGLAGLELDVERGEGALRGDRRADVGVQEIVLVAQDLASYGRDRSHGRPAEPRAGRSSHPPPAATGGDQPIVSLVRAVSRLVARTRLLYLYPSSLTDRLVDTVLATGVPYFDLSLQHVSRPHLTRMRRWGDGDRFLRRIERIRQAEPEATFRSSFILGYPGESEEDHDRLLEFLAAAQLDWAGFFTFSPEPGTYAVGRPDQVPSGLALERLQECTELQDAITERRRQALVGRRLSVLVDTPGIARSVREAPEIDGIINVPEDLPTGWLGAVEVTGGAGPDLFARRVDPSDPRGPSS